MTPKRYTVVKGVVIPRTHSDPNYFGPEFRTSEVDEIAEYIVGVPVYYHHNHAIGGSPVGKVVGAFVTSAGRENNVYPVVIADMHIYHVLPEAETIVEALEIGHLKGFSIGIDWLWNKNTKDAKYYKGKVFELSICAQGALDKSDIIYSENMETGVKTINAWAIRRFTGKDVVPPGNHHTLKSLDIHTRPKMSMPAGTDIQAIAAKLEEANRVIELKDKELKEIEERNALLSDLYKQNASDQLNNAIDSLKPFMNDLPGMDELKVVKMFGSTHPENVGDVTRFMYAVGTAMTNLKNEMSHIKGSAEAVQPAKSHIREPPAATATAATPAAEVSKPSILDTRNSGLANAQKWLSDMHRSVAESYVIPGQTHAQNVPPRPENSVAPKPSFAAAMAAAASVDIGEPVDTAKRQQMMHE